MSVDCGTGVSFKGDESITVFNSSEWTERGFCKNCGTHLFYRLKENQLYYMPAVLFDEGPALIFDSQVFIEENPSYCYFSKTTKEMPGAECFAEYGGGEE